MRTFFELITDAIADIEEHGFDSEIRLNRWMNTLLHHMRRKLTLSSIIEDQLRRTFRATYERAIKGDKLLKVHPGVSTFTINKIAPRLHAELERRILLSAKLIKLNREQAISTTLQRFSGWASSIPEGGSKVTDTRKVKSHIGKALSQLPYVERRVQIDQGHKLVSTINDIIATDGGAIAAKWRSHWRQSGYDYREDHKERDSKYYAIRNNWAIDKGLMNKGDGYTDEQTAPAEEVNCRCDYIYIYSLRKLPESMLTKKGLTTLQKIDS